MIKMSLKWHGHPSIRVLWNYCLLLARNLAILLDLGDE